MAQSAPGSSVRPKFSHPLLSPALGSVASNANRTVDSLLTDLQSIADHASRLSDETFGHSTVQEVSYSSVRSTCVVHA